MIRLPGVEMQRLAGFVGRWAFVESSPTESLKEDWSFQRGPAGLSLILEEVVHSERESHRAHGLLAWDPSDQSYRLQIADSRFAGVRALSGGWLGDDLVLVSLHRPEDDDPWSDLRFFDITADSFTLTVGGRRNAVSTEATRRYGRVGER